MVPRRTSRTRAPDDILEQHEDHEKEQTWSTPRVGNADAWKDNGSDENCSENADREARILDKESPKLPGRPRDRIHRPPPIARATDGLTRARSIVTASNDTIAKAAMSPTSVRSCPGQA